MRRGKRQEVENVAVNDEIDPAEVEGHVLAVWIVDTVGSDDELIWGVARRDGESLVVDWDHDQPPLPIPADTLHRIKRIDDDTLKAGVLEGADFVTFLRSGTMTPDAGSDGRLLPGADAQEREG